MNLGHEHLTADDDHARIYGEAPELPAPVCHGPGHLMDWDDDGFLVRVEDCPGCKGQVRNHLAWRLPDGVDL